MPAAFDDSTFARQVHGFMACGKGKKKGDNSPRPVKRRVQGYWPWSGCRGETPAGVWGRTPKSPITTHSQSERTARRAMKRAATAHNTGLRTPSTNLCLLAYKPANARPCRAFTRSGERQQHTTRVSEHLQQTFACLPAYMPAPTHTAPSCEAASGNSAQHGIANTFNKPLPACVQACSHPYRALTRCSERQQRTTRVGEHFQQTFACLRTSLPMLAHTVPSNLTIPLLGKPIHQQPYSLGQDAPLRLLHHAALERLGGVPRQHGHGLL